MNEAAPARLLVVRLVGGAEALAALEIASMISRQL